MTDDSYHALMHPPEGDAPLVFAFHGTGGDETQFFDFARQILPGAGVISPRGDVLEHGAARFFRRSAEGVYDMDDLARATEKMAAFVGEWKARHPGKKAYGFGYSNGANILASVMLAHPDLFDRIGLLHPLIPWEPEPVTGLSVKSVLITAGRHDPICPWPMTERLIGFLCGQGADVQTEIHDGGHEMRREEAAALVRLFQTR